MLRGHCPGRIFEDLCCDSVLCYETQLPLSYCLLFTILYFLDLTNFFLAPLEQTSLNSQLNLLSPAHFLCTLHSRNFCFVLHRRITGGAQAALDQGIRSAQKAAASAAADAAAREVEKQMSAGFGALKKKMK